jgi:hypothetical protein
MKAIINKKVKRKLVSSGITNVSSQLVRNISNESSARRIENELPRHCISRNGFFHPPKSIGIESIDSIPYQLPTIIPWLKKNPISLSDELRSFASYVSVFKLLNILSFK